MYFVSILIEQEGTILSSIVIINKTMNAMEVHPVQIK